MTMRFDAGTLGRLLKARLHLAGEGEFRFGDDARSGLALECVLPFGGSVIQATDGDRPVARILYPTGRKLSAGLRLRDPMEFASLLHNADVMMWPMRGWTLRPSMAVPGAAVGPGRLLPPMLVELADAAFGAATSQPGVAAALDAAWNAGSPLSAAPGGETAWQPTAEGLGILDACAASDDPALAGLAGDLTRSVGKRWLGDTLDDRHSLIRWHDQIATWMARDAGVAPQVVDAGGGRRWVEVLHPVGIVAEARRIGRLEGEFEAGNPRSLGEPQSADERRRWLRSVIARISENMRGAGVSRMGEFVGGDREIWSLKDAHGDTAGLAIRDGDDLWMEAPMGCAASAFVSHADALVTLRDALGMDRGPNMMR